MADLAGTAHPVEIEHEQSAIVERKEAAPTRVRETGAMPGAEGAAPVVREDRCTGWWERADLDGMPRIRDVDDAQVARRVLARRRPRLDREGEYPSIGALDEGHRMLRARAPLRTESRRSPTVRDAVGTHDIGVGPVTAEQHRRRRARDVVVGDPAVDRVPHGSAHRERDRQQITREDGRRHACGAHSVRRDPGRHGMRPTTTGRRGRDRSTSLIATAGQG